MIGKQFELQEWKCIRGCWESYSKP